MDETKKMRNSKATTPVQYMVDQKQQKNAEYVR